MFKIQQIQTTSYHPQTNGALERSHATLADYLRHYITTDQHNWDTWIPFGIFSYNTSVHSTTKYSPFELVYGHLPSLPTALKTTEFRYTYETFLDDLKLKLSKSHEIARNNIIANKEKAKERYNIGKTPRTFKIGDNVYLTCEATKLNRSKKLSPKYEGPYEIIKIHNPLNVSLKIKNKIVRVHTNRIKYTDSN